MSTEAIQDTLNNSDAYQGAGFLIVYVLFFIILAKAAAYVLVFFVLTRCILYIVGIAAKKPVLVIIASFSQFLSSDWKLIPLIIETLAGKVIGAISFILFLALTVFALVFAIMLIAAQREKAVSLEPQDANYSPITSIEE